MMVTIETRFDRAAKPSSKSKAGEVNPVVRKK